MNPEIKPPGPDLSTIAGAASGAYQAYEYGKGKLAEMRAARAVPPTYGQQPETLQPASYRGGISEMGTGVIPRPATTVSAEAEDLISTSMMRPPPIPTDEFGTAGSDLMASGASTDSSYQMPTMMTKSRATIHREAFEGRLNTTARGDLQIPEIKPPGVLDRIFNNMANRFSEFQNNRAQQALAGERQRLADISKNFNPQQEEMATRMRNQAIQWRNAGPDTREMMIRGGRQPPPRGPRPFGEMTESSQASSTATTLQRNAPMSEISSMETVPSAMSSATQEDYNMRERSLAEYRGPQRSGFRRFEDGYDTTATSEQSLNSQVSTNTARRALGVDYPASQPIPNAQPSRATMRVGRNAIQDQGGEEMQSVVRSGGGQPARRLTKAERQAMKGETSGKYSRVNRLDDGTTEGVARTRATLGVDTSATARPAIGSSGGGNLRTISSVEQFGQEMSTVPSSAGAGAAAVESEAAAATAAETAGIGAGAEAATAIESIAEIAAL